MEKQIKSMVITAEEGVKIRFFRPDVVAGSKQKKGEDSEDEDEVKVPKYDVDSPYHPHPDLLSILQKIRKHAIDINEIDLKSTSGWECTGIKIAGDVVLKKSRVQIRLSKYVKRSKKYVHMAYGPQVTMYPDKEETVMYPAADKLTELIEELLDEIELYLNGKYGEDFTAEQGEQLALFFDRELATA